MVDFLSSPTSREGKEDAKSQSSQVFKRETNPISLSLTDPEVSFADSLLDFDFIEDWIEEVPELYDIMASDDLGENPVGFSGGKVEFDVSEKSIEMGSDEFREKIKVKESYGEDGGNLESVDHEEGEPEVSEKGVVGDLFRKKLIVEEGTVGDGEGMLGDLGCLIEKEMGKVSLDGVSNSSVLTIGGVSGIKSSEGISSDISSVNSHGIENCSGDIMKRNEFVNAFGNDMEDGGVVTASGEAGEIVGSDTNGVKGREHGSDQNESGSDSDSVNETESSSSSLSPSSSSSDDDDDEEEEEEEKRGSGKQGERKEENKKVEVEGEMDIEEGEIMASDVEEMVAWSGDEYDEDDVNGGIAPVGPIRSKNELMVLPPVPPVKVTLLPHHQTLPVGAVLSIIGSQVIVEGVEKHNPLNEGSVLWITESRSPLGLVDEIFGPVKNPYYIIRYNSESEVPTGIQPGTSVSFVPEFANHVLNDKRLYQKGYDASGANDEEISDEEEFSDDEKEAEYRKMLKLKKRGTSDEKVDNKKKGKRKSKNQPGNWNCDQATNLQVSSRNAKPPVDHTEHPFPPVAPPPNHGSRMCSSGLEHGFAVQPGMAPQLAQLGTSPNFNTSSAGSQGFRFQQPQSMGLPGLPTNPMPWVQQVHPLYQMPFQNGVPFQQHMDTTTNFPSNPVVSGGQPGFTAPPPFVPWPACLGPNMFYPSPYGMGALGQQTPFPINMGENQSIPSNINMGGYNSSRQPENSIAGNLDSSPSFNHGKYLGGGRNAHRRRGGRFGGGRGRQ